MSQTPNVPFRQRITIPANTGLGVKLRALISPPDRSFLEIEIIETLADGTDHTAFVVASPRSGATEVVESDFATDGRYVRAGDPYLVPGPNGLDDFVRSSTASPIYAIIEML